jgi:hypothetical protein
METFTTPTHSPVNQLTLKERVYEVMQIVPNQPVTAKDVADLMPELTVTQVQSVLVTFGKASRRFPHMHRLDRGVYMYDASRERTWVKFPNQTRANRRSGRRRAAKNRATSISQPTLANGTSAPTPLVTMPVLETKRVAEQPVVSVTNLTPVPNVTVMQDSDGKMYLVQATLVS